MTFERIKKVFIASWVFLIPIQFQISEISCPNNLFGFFVQNMYYSAMLLFNFLQKYDIKNRCHVIQEFESHNLIRILDVNVKSADFNYWTYIFEGYKKYKEKKEKYVVSNFVLESKVTFFRFIKSSVSFPYPNCQSESRVKHRRA